jgi:hydroxymethylpyrimidine pyrophosphatase-like HAD family hydrolase
VNGTVVTRAKVVTACAIEAIEKLHDRQGALRDHQRRPPRGMRMLVHRLGTRGPIAASNGRIIVQPLL